MQHIKEVVLDKRLDDELMDVMLRIKKGKTRPHREPTRLGLPRTAAILTDESQFPLLTRRGFSVQLKEPNLMC